MARPLKLFGHSVWGAFSGFGMLIAVLAFATDRLHKWWSLHVLDMPNVGRITVTPNFDIVMAWNKGVSYGLFQADSTLGLVGLVVFALAIVIGLGLWLAKAEHKWLAIAIGSSSAGRWAMCWTALSMAPLQTFLVFMPLAFTGISSISQTSGSPSASV